MSLALQLSGKATDGRGWVDEMPKMWRQLAGTTKVINNPCEKFEDCLCNSMTFIILCVTQG